jgi:hypothetical protein
MDETITEAWEHL